MKSRITITLQTEAAFGLMNLAERIIKTLITKENEVKAKFQDTSWWWIERNAFPLLCVPTTEIMSSLTLGNSCVYKNNMIQKEKMSEGCVAEEMEARRRPRRKAKKKKKEKIEQ